MFLLYLSAYFLSKLCESFFGSGQLTPPSPHTHIPSFECIYLVVCACVGSYFSSGISGGIALSVVREMGHLVKSVVVWVTIPVTAKLLSVFGNLDENHGALLAGLLEN